VGREVPAYFTRAEGSLSYPLLMQALESVWKRVNPIAIPLYAYGVAKEEVTFPCIVFNLTRRDRTDEIKPKVREEIHLQDGSFVRMRGQRFLDTVSFIICTDGDPRTADLLVETFEDFMLEYTGVFKRLGVSELLYGRRYKDTLDTSWGDNIVTRWVDYHVTTEKVYAEDQAKLEEISLMVRAQLEGTYIDADETITSEVPAP
jgi:hypothetical protein